MDPPEHPQRSNGPFTEQSNIPMHGPLPAQASMDTGPLLLSTKSRLFPGVSETHKYLRDLFETDFNTFESFLGPNHQVGEAFIKTMDGLMRRTVVEEFQRPQQYISPTGEVLSAEPVLMFKRSAFVQNMLQKGGYNPESGQFAKDPAFVFLDLKNLFAANSAGSADWMLLKVAGSINQTVKAYFEKIGHGNDYATCRYGGDEFLVGTAGLTDEQNRELQELVQTDINALRGFYRDEVSGGTIEKPVELNTDKSIIIKQPEQSVEREIFNTYLNRGLILDTEQIHKIKDVFAPDGVLDRSKFQQATKGNDTGSDMDQKISSILMGDPDLSYAMTLADFIDRKEIKSQIPSDKTKRSYGKRKENLVNMLEGVVYDGLLGENVLSLEGMQSKIMKGEIGELVCVDLKYVKEVNETASYAEGDMAIENLWRSIDTGLSLAERRTLVFARRGGTFVIGLRKGLKDYGVLGQICSSMDTTHLLVRDEHTDVPLGISRTTIDSSQKSLTRSQAGETVGILFHEAENNWYGKAATILKSNPNLIAVFDYMNDCIKTGTPLSELTNDIHERLAGIPIAGLDNRLIIQFFFGKPGLRTDMRINRIMDELYGGKSKARDEGVAVQ